MIKKVMVFGLLMLIAGTSSAVQIRVATYNVEYGFDGPGSEEWVAITSMLTRVGADIVGMNELTTSAYDNFIMMAAYLGYPYTAFSTNYNAMTGGSRLGYMSRFPIISSAAIPQYPGALEVARPPLRCVFDVPGALNNFVAYEVHYKASQTDPDEFQRAIEVRRTRNHIIEYMTNELTKLDTEFVVMGDMNDDIDEYPGQTTSFSSMPSGMNDSFVLGSDVDFPVAYRVFPNDRFSEDIDFLTLHPYREDSTEDGTSWQSDIRWDYMIFSRDIMESPYGAPMGEVYHSKWDDGAGTGGLPKYGYPLNNWIISNGPNHCIVFADFHLMDLLPCLNPVLLISEIVDSTVSTNANYVELYNSGTTALSLTNYQLVIYIDGSSPATVSLTGNLAPGGKYVIASHSNEFVSTYPGKFPTQISTWVNRLNGNDVVAIKNPNNMLTDLFGGIGEPTSGSDYSMAWAYNNKRAERIFGISDPSADFITNEWTIGTSSPTPGVHSACDEASIYYANIEMDPFAPATGVSFVVSADIQPNLPASNLAPTVYYRLNSDSWSSIGMTNVSGTVWAAPAINPGAEGDDNLYYYILTTYDGPSAIPAPSITNTYKYPPKPGSAGDTPRFNEIEFNSAGTDGTNPVEFIEIIAPAGMNMSGYYMVHYNGGTSDGGEWTWVFPSFVVPDDSVTDVYNTALGFVVVGPTGCTIPTVDFASLTNISSVTGILQGDGDGLVLYDSAGNVMDAIGWGAGFGDMMTDDPGPSVLSTNPPTSADNYLHDLNADTYNDDRSVQAPNDVLSDDGTSWARATATPGAINSGQTSGSITIGVPAGTDEDGDGIGSYTDNCPDDYNPTQSDIDGDGIGNACDDDRDGDGVANASDNCPDTPNADQSDVDSDGTGDVCDYDNDNDGVDDEIDNCIFTWNPGQEDTDDDGIGDACDEDWDNDGTTNAVDNCPTTSNADQSDLDSDGIGDVCDPDIDGDGVNNDVDNCPLTYNPTQTDSNSDGIGDVCSNDSDLDGVDDSLDNCPGTYNPDQADDDNDGLGNACDDCTGVYVTNLLASAEFETGQPAGWTVRTNAGANAAWRFDNPKFKENYTGGTGLFAVCQSDMFRKTDMDTELLTPSMDMGLALIADLQFKTDFDWDRFGDNEKCDVDVSLNGSAGPWSNVWRKQGADYRGPATEKVDISFAAGSTNVVIRFRYYDAYQEYWWQVDDVKVICELCDADHDSDGDGIPDISDNCPDVWNPTQADIDGDDAGDDCDDDIDGDGIVNDWESLYEMDPYDDSDALLDDDSDGMINLYEYQADTSPTNFNSVLRISNPRYTKSTDRFGISFPSSTSRIYRVEFNDGNVGNSNDWYVGIAPFTGKVGSSTVTDSTVNAVSPGAIRYYRVRAEVP